MHLLSLHMPHTSKHTITSTSCPLCKLSMMPSPNCTGTLMWTAGLVTGPFLWRPGAPPSEEASHLLVSFRSPGPLLHLLSGPIRTLTGGSQPVKSHLSAVRTGLETPYTLLPFPNIPRTRPASLLHPMSTGFFWRRKKQE